MYYQQNVELQHIFQQLHENLKDDPTYSAIPDDQKINYLAEMETRLREHEYLDDENDEEMEINNGNVGDVMLVDDSEILEDQEEEEDEEDDDDEGDETEEADNQQKVIGVTILDAVTSPNQSNSKLNSKSSNSPPLTPAMETPNNNLSAVHSTDSTPNNQSNSVNIVPSQSLADNKKGATVINLVEGELINRLEEHRIGEELGKGDAPESKN